MSPLGNHGVPNFAVQLQPAWQPARQQVLDYPSAAFSSRYAGLYGHKALLSTNQLDVHNSYMGHSLPSACQGLPPC